MNLQPLSMESAQSSSNRLTLTATRTLLDELGHFPIRKWGQNFLVDHNIVEKSLQLADVEASNIVVEVGPGLGCLSASLLKAGAIVYAVEIDKKLANHLRNHFHSEPNFHLFEGDAVENPFGNKPEDDQPWKIVANLPYAISTPWLEKILRMKNLPKSITLMLQKEAVQRLTAKVGSKHYSAFSILLQSLYTIGAEHSVAKQCFYPVPGVDSQLLNLVRIEGATAFSTNCRETMRTLFTQRRKQIGNLCKQFLPEEIQKPWLKNLETLGFTEKSRPETLPLACWQALDTILAQHYSI